MSETLTPEMHGRVPRRQARRLKVQIAAQEQELARRHHTTLSLAADVSSLRAALASALADRTRLERELDRLAHARAEEAEHARKLARAALDQQAAVLELEHSVGAVLDERF